jgi:hypothetical protein
MTISDLARAEGVDKALISRRVKKHKLETLPGPRGAKFVDEGEYRRAMGRSAAAPLHTPPCDELEMLIRKGHWRGQEATIRQMAGHHYRALVLRADLGDRKAQAALVKINGYIGLDAAETCRCVLVTGRPLFAVYYGHDKKYAVWDFGRRLDQIAWKLGFLKEPPRY